jgi:hypothetical protein
MRYATANTTGKVSYSDLLDSCQHSRLRAALSAHLAPTSRPNGQRPLIPVQPPLTVSDATKAYLWVTAMSVASLFGVIVTGTVNA